MEHLKIEYLLIGDLKPYEQNARQHGEPDVEAIAASIREFGFDDPIGIWGDENLIVEGHGRLLAAERLNMKQVPVIRLDHLTDEQRRAYALAHNKTAELSGWNFATLDSELAQIAEIDMSLFGFNVNAVDPQIEIVEDEIPEDVETRCKPGDLWQLGEHRLICGDSTDLSVVDELMDGRLADCVFTDPPYNIASDSKNYAADVSKAMKELSESEWDKNFDIVGALDNILVHISNDATVYICTSHFLASDIWDWMKQWSDYYSYCVWSKPNPMPSLSKRHWTWNTELICYATRGKHTFNFPEEGHALSTWTISKVNGKTGHPTEKPVEVPAMAIKHSSNKNDLIMDLFGGSGSTLIACEQLNRKCYMAELDPHYCDVIIERWEKFTGEKAVLLAE